MQCIPSSLNSLAQGCCALAPGEVLAPCCGILVPDHDGFFFVFAAEVRSSFDEAEPMLDWSGVREMSDRQEGPDTDTLWKRGDPVMFDICTFTCSRGQKKKLK